MPLREQKPRILISAMVCQPHYKVLLLKRNGTPIGFSIIFYPLTETFCLLEYMAIHTMYRNSGLGRQLFLRSIQDVVASRGSIPVLLEVDSDRERLADLTMIRKRQQFYRRLGCLRVDGLSYVLPLPGVGPPPEMDLLIYFPDCASVIRKAQLEQWLTVIYKSVYDCSPEDPRLTKMTSTLPDPVVLVQ
jgi:hypothetical protein